VCRFQGSCCAIQPEITIPPSNPAVRAKPLPKVDPAVAPTALPIRKAAYQNTKVGMARSRSRTINNAGSPSSIHQLDYFRGRRITTRVAMGQKATSFYDQWPPIELIVTCGRHRVRTGELPPRAKFLPKPLQARCTRHGNKNAALLTLRTQRHRGAGSRALCNHPSRAIGA
jgi:hypothetical protein